MSGITVNGLIKMLMRDIIYLFVIVLGIGCELIYFFYFVRTFSVVQYRDIHYPLEDLGQITQNSHTGFYLYVLSFSVVFVLSGLAWWNVRQLRGRGGFIIVFLFGAIFVGTMIFCYPITANDVFIYIAQSHVLVTHHANPLVTPAITFADDPVMVLAGQWGQTGASYGPLGILIDALPTLVVGKDVFWNLLLLKGMFGIMLLGCAWLIYAIVSQYAPRYALAAMLLFIWNPFVLFEYSANAHNDVAVVLFVLLALFALKKEHPILAFACIIASASIKYATVPLLPLFFMYGIIHQPTRRRRLIFALGAVDVALLLIALLYGPFWAGPHTLDSAIAHDNWYLGSFSVFISDIAPLHITGDRARLVGRIIFACFFLYALWLTRKGLAGTAQASALTMFMFLAFGTVKFESWYALWGVALLLLVPGREWSVVCWLFSFGATLIASIFAFIWVWGGRNMDMYGGLNSLNYLLAFAPALLFLSAYKLQRAFYWLRRTTARDCPYAESNVFLKDGFKKIDNRAFVSSRVGRVFGLLRGGKVDGTGRSPAVPLE